MKISQASLLALLLPAVSARFVEDHEIDRVDIYTNWAKQVDEASQKYHIELSPGETRWVTEEEKWELRRVSLNT
jgi:leucyl aminopeptidase